MTIQDYLSRKIPDYYDGMHQDGFTPQEILYAAHRDLINKSVPKQSTDIRNVNIKSEIKIK